MSRILSDTEQAESDEYDFQVIMDDRDARLEMATRPCRKHADGKHQFVDMYIIGRRCACGARDR